MMNLYVFLYRHKSNNSAMIRLRVIDILHSAVVIWRGGGQIRDVLLNFNIYNIMICTHGEPYDRR